MLIYFSVIILSLILSMFKLPKAIENIGLLIIGIFLCAGYMTGSDWYNYEQYYTNPDYLDQLKKLEVGYVFLQSFFSNLGVEFWIFHISVKLLVFFAIVRFVRYFKLNIFLFLAFFIPETGLYLFIDCPFRNLIALGIALIALMLLFDKKTLWFFIFTAIALLFHLSALVLIPIYFLYKKNINTLFILIAGLVLYLLAYNVEFLMKSLFLPLTKISPVISERLKYYFINTRYVSDEIGLGVFIRFFVLLILLLFKETIIAGDTKRQYFFNLTVLFLLLYPFTLTVKIFYRFSLFLIPFYISSIVLMITSFKTYTNKLLLYSFFILLYFKQTFSLVTYDYRYVPYTNYIIYYYSKDLPSIDYRELYNHKHSPYRNKNKPKE